MPVLNTLAEVPVGVSPNPRRRSCMSGIFTILMISVLSRLTISSGVLDWREYAMPRVANYAIHI